MRNQKTVLLVFSFLWGVLFLCSTVAQPFTSSSRKQQQEEWLAESQREQEMIKDLFHGKVAPFTLSPYQAMARIPHTVNEYDKASGSWFGRRDFLSTHGIDFSVTYTSDLVGNPVGGVHPGGCAYADAIAIACLFHTEKLFGWHGGYFNISAVELNGNSLSKLNIHNLFIVQQLYAVQTIHFDEMAYEQRFWDDRASIKAGRVLAGSEFASSPLYWLYMNDSIDGNPFSLRVNGRFTAFFNASWGSRLKVDLPHSTVARLGAYQITRISRYGLNWNFYANDGVMLLSQYEWDPIFHKDFGSEKREGNPDKEKPSSNAPRSTVYSSAASKGFAGHYWMGGYYSTWEYPQFNSTIQASNSYGLYWHADQTVYRANPLNETGLILWSTYLLCPRENISLVPFQMNYGAVYTGLIPGRINDFTILGINYGTLSKSYAGVQQQKGKGYPTYELVYEFGYRINMTKFAYVQPDIQWVVNPGGTGNIPNALVLGAQIGVVF